MQTYPAYPRLRPQVRPIDEYPKDSLDSLMKVYDRLTALGLYVLPKRRDMKVPVNTYWKKKDPEILTRELAVEEQKKYNVSGWCVATGERSNRLFVLDFDTAAIERAGYDPYAVYAWVQGISETGFVLSSPSGGVHLYYRLPDDFEMISNLKPPIDGIDTRGEGGQVVTVGGYNRYDGDKARDKGVPDGHCETYRFLEEADYSCIPLMSVDLYKWITSERAHTQKNANKNPDAEKYARTEQGEARLQAHLAEKMPERERIVLECLDFILPTWENEKKDYNADWIPMWMSAHIGSDGSPAVRDFILTHPSIYWKNGEDGKAQFRNAWDTFIPRIDGVTVTTLFYMAKQAGWLSKTGYEIPDALTKAFNERYVTNWMQTLDKIPPRALLISQTGSGKTYGLRYLWEILGKPKTVIFVPSIKLATELAHTLQTIHEIPAVLYIDNEKGRAIDTEELIKAHVLVTTLQTFAIRLFEAGVPMSNYGLVYIEECDQLLAQFASGGGGLYGSHVSEREARSGYAALREAYALCSTVWGVDATMSKVSYDVATAFQAGHSVEVFRNTWVEPKANVTFLDSEEQGYAEVLGALENNKKVVVAADTATTAEKVEEAMRMIGALKGKKSIVITRNTERRKEVREFMADVNRGAAEYDLVCYNSSMASGVSIDKVTPDLIVQFCTYLTPRVNLQIANRYRTQKRFLCYYRSGENVYSRRAHDIVSEAHRRAYVESRMVNIPVAERTDDAKLRAHILAISQGDKEQQERAARDFYAALLRQDGRQVILSELVVIPEVVKEARDAVKSIRKERARELAKTWKETPPIDRDRPALPGYTPMQIAQGEIHAHIDHALLRNIPQDVDPEFVYDTVYEFLPHLSSLAAFVNQGRALKKSELFLADRSKALTALTTHISLVRSAATLHHLYHDLTEELTPDLLKERAPRFIQALSEVKEAYDVGSSRPHDTYDYVAEKYPEPEKQAVVFAKKLLSRLGLKQRAERVGSARFNYVIQNAEAAQRFLEWRGNALSFEDAPVVNIIEARADYLKIFRAMDSVEQSQVLDMMEQEKVEFKIATLTIAAHRDIF